MLAKKRRNTMLWKIKINNFLIMNGFEYFIINSINQLIRIIQGGSKLLIYKTKEIKCYN